MIDHTNPLSPYSGKEAGSVYALSGFWDQYSNPSTTQWTVGVFSTHCTKCLLCREHYAWSVRDIGVAIVLNNTPYIGVKCGEVLHTLLPLMASTAVSVVFRTLGVWLECCNWIIPLPMALKESGHLHQCNIDDMFSRPE